MEFGDPRLPARFWAKCAPDVNTGCWLWHGAKDGHGYGQIWWQGRVWLATKLVWQLANGPTKQHKLHRCDTPGCVNPAHLFAGSQGDNIRDAVSKGRHRNGREGVIPARILKARRNREYGEHVARQDFREDALNHE